MMTDVNAVVRPSSTLDAVVQLAAAAERFAVAVAWADLRAPVPGCPGWTVRDLVVHLGNVHAWAATIVETGRAAPEQNDEPRSARSRAVSAWYAAKAEDLQQVLEAADPSAPCWNFVHGSGQASFWPRRQLHETTVHQVDLDHALGRTTQVAAEVAVDGVDEVLGTLLHRMHTRGHPAVLERPLALTATDTGDTWVLTPRAAPGSSTMVPGQPVGTAAETVPAAAPTVERRTAPAPVGDAVEGPSDVLLRVLWKRLPLDEADVRFGGDEDRVRAFLASRLVP
jgi:uncharacterized protein (TIGR03083 family)